MATKKLNARQARWAGFFFFFFFQFYLLIRYRPGRDILANALSRPSTKIEKKKNEYRQQILLKPESVEKTVHLNTLEPALQVVDQVLKANRESTAEYREKAQEGCDNEVHTQVSTARAGRTKIQQLIRARYYWPAWRRDVERY